MLVPSAAVAGSYTSPDNSGDVVKYDNGSDPTATKVPDRAEGDILSSRVVHGPRRVTMAMHADELSKVANGALYLFRVGTRTKTRWLYIDTAPGHWRGAKFFENRKGNKVRCRGITWRVDYVADTVRASVPKRCVGGRSKPWVHVGMLLLTYDGGNLKPIYADDPRTNGYIGTSGSALQAAWGPKVFK